MLWLFVAICFTNLFDTNSFPQVNPCVALKLPLCRIKSDFAQEHGIQTERPKTTTSSPRFRPTLNRQESTSSVTREGDTLIVTPSKVVAEDESPPTPLRSTLIDRLRSRPSTSSNTGACQGLRFCVLSKNVESGDRKPTARPTTTEDPLIEQFLANTGSGGNLLDLVINGNLEEAMKLIEDGADVNSADQHGNSVLHLAAQNGRAGIIDELILRGADVNKGNNHKNTALHLAAQNGWDEIAAKLLRAKKIDVNFKDLHANTALHLAAQNGQVGVARLLIDAGANVNAPNAHKHIPLHLAAQNGHLALSKILVEGGSNMDYQDLIGNTPLHTAVHTTHTEIAKFLVASGANENKRNSSGLTPFQLVGK